MADWDEIKRLAADFQKVQLSSTSQKLSERNCVEIVSWLIEKKVVDLIFTTDGKEYLTSAELVKEILDELYVSGGRINLVDLAKIIGVDLAHINSHLGTVLKTQKNAQCILGYLIDNSYIIRIAGEINEKLAQQGQININDLSIQYDLPTDFILHKIVEKHLGKIIFGQQDKNDENLFFTQSFIARSIATIRGGLIALTRPTSVLTICTSINLTEKLFFSLFDQACNVGYLTSRTSGAQYIPNVYSKSQSDWVANFYKQNNYLEFDALTRLGISDYKSYLKKMLANEATITLSSCVASKALLERLEADIDECISSKTFLDLEANVPSVFSEQDIKMLLDSALSNMRRQQTIVIEQFVLSKSYIDSLMEGSEIVKEKAKNIVESGKYQEYQTQLVLSSSKGVKVEEMEDKLDKREERRKKATVGKSGGGSQGRETKMKSTKKHVRTSANTKNEDEDVEIPQKKKLLEIVTEKDIQNVISTRLEDDGLDVLLQPISKHFHPILNEEGLQIAATLYASTVSDRTANRRQTHNELQTKLNVLIGDVRLFEKGIKLFSTDTQAQLYKYLLKSSCTEIVNEILSYVAQEQNLTVPLESFNQDQKLKFVNDLPNEFKTALVSLVKSLNAQNIDEFMSVVEEALISCSMIVKKIDKKKDRITVLNHRHQLLEELNKCEDLALVLHLAVLVLFTTATQCMLHASGRHVSAVLTVLKQYLTQEESIELANYHDYVTLMLSGGSEVESVREKLKELVPSIKKIANEFKRQSSEKS